MNDLCMEVKSPFPQIWRLHHRETCSITLSRSAGAAASNIRRVGLLRVAHLFNVGLTQAKSRAWTPSIDFPFSLLHFCLSSLGQGLERCEPVLVSHISCPSQGHCQIHTTNIESEYRPGIFKERRRRNFDLCFYLARAVD